MMENTHVLRGTILGSFLLDSTAVESRVKPFVFVFLPSFQSINVSNCQWGQVVGLMEYSLALFAIMVVVREYLYQGYQTLF